MGAHLGQVLEEFPKFDDDDEDEEGGDGSGHLRSGGWGNRRVSVGGMAQRSSVCAPRGAALPTPAAHLCVAPGALLYQAPRHGAAHREALEEAPDEVTETKGHQLLLRRAQM